MKYKVVDMINRSTESSIDQLIDVEKVYYFNLKFNCS